MIEDMTVRGFTACTQRGYIAAVKNFTVFLGRSPEQANPEDLRRFQLHMRSEGASATTMNAAVGRPDIAINTVGMVMKKPIAEVSEEEFDLSSAVNVKSAFFFLKEAGKAVNDNGKICTIVTSLLGAYTPFYAAYEGLKAPTEHFTRAASKELGERGISVTAIGPGPMDTPFFYPAEGEDAVAYHKTAAALSPFSKTGLTDIEDITSWVRFMVSEGWWMTGQTILVNGGYTTK
jgi:NAD(P)-dependent dehydrogenase (short-subunit alcohol dehydrogenase family)